MTMRRLYLQIRYSLPFSFVMFMTEWIPDMTISVKLRGIFVKPFLYKCGKNFQISRDVTILSPHRITVGDNVFIGKGCWLNAKGGIVLENEVLLAPYVVISSLQHTLKNRSYRFGESLHKEVRIKAGSWIAAGCSVKCGVTIGEYNVIGANSFVVSDTENGAFSSGVPARVITIKE